MENRKCKVVKGYYREGDIPMPGVFDGGNIPIPCGKPATEHRTSYVSRVPSTLGTLQSTNEQNVDLHYCPDCAERFDADQVRIKKDITK